MLACGRRCALPQKLTVSVLAGAWAVRPGALVPRTTPAVIALAATSNNWAIRAMGRAWGRLHRLAYVIAALGVTHFFMAVKSWPPRPIVYAVIIAVLLGYRLVVWIRGQRRAA